MLLTALLLLRLGKQCTSTALPTSTWASWVLDASLVQLHCRGWTVSVTQVLLMASPLSGLLRAVQQRSSANFHLGVCSMGLVSSTLWTIYAMVGLLWEACKLT